MPNKRDHVGFWAVRLATTVGFIVAVVCAIATGGMLVHGQPLYAILLAATAIICAVAAVRSWLTRTVTPRRHRILRSIAFVVGVLLIAVVAWLVPSSAVQPALDAMTSDSRVIVSETPGEITLVPTGVTSETGVFFQPGARVDARAYAAVLRPLAEAGHIVIITKQPLGIAFLATGAFATVRDAWVPVTRWVVGGHSLGGTVACLDASAYAGASTEPVVGLLLFASYPAGDISGMSAKVLSVSGSDDGLATPASIDASKSSLPADTDYVVVDGGVHAFFGDYGPQAGDGQPTISHDDARAQISEASVAFVDSLSPTT